MGTEVLLRAPDSGLFISAPGDMDEAARKTINIFETLHTQIPGGWLEVHYWRKDFDSFSATAALPTQVQIARTSAETVDPIIVLFGEKLGTTVALPRPDQRSLRRRLDGAGFTEIGILGQDFDHPSEIPDGCVPLTGTLFELFDACLPPLNASPPQVSPQKQVRVIFQGATDPQTGRYDHGFGRLRRAIVEEEPAAEASDTERAAWQQRYDDYQQQRTWLELFHRLWGQWRTALRTDNLLRDHGLIVDFTHLDDEARFEALITETLKSALGLAVLDPRRDALPALLAVPVERHRLFFGRRDLIEALEQQIFATGLVVLQGESGCGKSSLLRAGLIGHWSRWRMRGDCLVAMVAEPRGLARRGDPLRGLAESLFGAAGAQPRAVEPAHMADTDAPQLLHREIDGPYPYSLGLADAAEREQRLGATPSINAFLDALTQATPLADGQPLHLCTWS